jgi:putative MFS transporter
VGLATAISRIGAAIGTYLVPISLDGIGTGPTMLIGAGLTMLGFVISIFWAEETRNRSLSAAADTSAIDKRLSEEGPREAAA